MSKQKSQSQQAIQMNLANNKAAKGNKPQISIVNIQTNYNSINSKTPPPNEKTKIAKVENLAKTEISKTASTAKSTMASRSQSTGIGSTRLNSVSKKIQSQPSAISDIFETSNQRNQQGNKFKSVFPQGSIIQSTENFTSSKSKQEPLKPVKKARVLDEVNSNLQKLKLGVNISKTVSSTRKNSNEKKINASKVNPVKEVITPFPKAELIKATAQAPVTAKPKQVNKEGNINKIFSPTTVRNVPATASKPAPSLKITNIQTIRSVATQNSTSLSSYFNGKPASKDKYLRTTKEVNVSIEDKARATTRPKDIAAKQSNFSKQQKPSFSNLRKLIEKEECKDKKLPTPKQEAAVILRNLNIDNSSALENLFLKNSKAIEKITNLNTENEESEIVYPSIDRSQIDSTYLKSYMEVVESITKAFKTKNIYPETTINFYKYGRQLGRGAFGKVNLGVHIATGRVVAIKSFKLNDAEIASIRRRLHLETQLMKTLNHPNVLKMYETFETDKHLMIALEYISGGDLLSFLRKRIKVSEQIAKFIFKQLMEGLKYMHSQGIIHRDVKLDNILIDTDSTIKLCDLGVSKLIRPGEIMMEQCGTPAYIAPEIIQGENYSGFGADLWSSGVVLYSLLSGTMPFKANNMNDLQNLIVSANYSELKDISKDANELICSLLEIDPKKRLTAEQVLSHPFLKDSKKKLK